MRATNAIGKRLPNVGARAKATGEARYIADIKLPRMLYGKILRSALPHARLPEVNTHAAQRMIGVRATVSKDTAPPVRVGIMIPDETAVAIDKVRFVGEPVAAVAAVDPDAASEALDLIHVEYEELPAVFDPLKAMLPSTPQIHQAHNNVAVHYEFSHGDWQEGLKAADLIVEETYQTSVVHQCYLEPSGAVADFGASGRLTVWAPIQNPFGARSILAKALGMSTRDIRIIVPPVGGGFGGKEDHTLALICALLAKQAGQPVKIVVSRREEFIAARPRVPMIIRLKTGVRADGTLLAKETQIIADNGACSHHAPGVTQVAAARIDSLYRYPAIHTAADLVYTNNTPTGAYRGYGNPQVTFAVESHMDTLAERLGIDPLEIRLKNATQSGDRTIHGRFIRSCGLTECLERCAEAMQGPQKRAKSGHSRGIGLAATIHVSGVRPGIDYNGSAAFVQMTHEGKIEVTTGEVDIGQGAKTVLSLIAAEELGVSPEDVRVSDVDTDTSPHALGTWGSRVTYVAGNAVRAAAADVRAQLLESAAQMLEANVDDLVIEKGRIFVQGVPAKALALGEVATHRRVPILGRGTFDADDELLDPQTLYGQESAAYPFGVQVAEVEVDEETGQVWVLKMTCAHDVGRVLNSMAAEGQVEGGVLQGLGYALTEEILKDEGHVRNANLLDYKIPTALDAPFIETIFVETHDPTGPFGAKGLGEPVLVPTAAAIANAIYHATGARVRQLPITPEKVLQALERCRHSGR